MSDNVYYVLAVGIVGEKQLAVKVLRLGDNFCGDILWCVNWSTATC